ncbi:MAG: RagB/SusD family nutrient uptake outer membrane protein, partial [Prevotella sp.]|nr:RagB/SusD family nutrient uptake outer membrane protein [Prevotella sp.]
MKKDFLKYIVLSLALVSLTGCGDFLEESSQDNDYVRSWKDLNELLLGGCYMEVNPTAGYAAFVVESNKGMFLHLLADEVEENNFGDRHFDNHEREFAYLTWQQRTGMKETFNGFFTENNTWTQIYKNINVANNILKSVVDVPVTLDSEKEGATRVSGEAHFLRGFYYFWLVNLYGNPYDPNTASKDLGVPIKTSELVEDQ